MLSDMIGEVSGSVTGVRVIPSDGGPPKLEVSFRGAGQFLDVPCESFGTAVRTLHEDNTYVGESEFVFVTSDGDTASWKAIAIGAPTGRGHGVRSAACGTFHQASGKLAVLARWPMVVEFESDESDKISLHAWQWTA